MDRSIFHVETYYPALRAACRKAQESVWLMAYVMSGNMRRRADPLWVLLKILEIKCKQGIDVRIILDSPKPGRQNFHANRVFCRRLYDFGIPFALPGRFMTSHAKCALIDKSTFFCGSHNLTKHSLFNPYDCTIETDSQEVITSFIDYFSTVWSSREMTKYPPSKLDFERIYP